MVTALQFFLGHNEDDEDSDDEDELPNIRALQHKQTVSKKTKSKAKQMEKTLATLKKKQKAKKKAETFNFSALHLLNDPQGKRKQDMIVKQKRGGGRATSEEKNSSPLSYSLLSIRIHGKALQPLGLFS